MTVELIVILDELEKSLYKKVCESPTDSLEFPLPQSPVQAAELARALQHLEDASLIFILQTPTEEEPCFYVELTEVEPPLNEVL